MNPAPSCIIMLFGATGDLAKRKLYPAFFSLFKERMLSGNFALVGIARRPWSPEEFRGKVKESVAEYGRHKIGSEEEWSDFAKSLHYYPLDVHDRQGFAGLKQLVQHLERHFSIPGNRMFYLAMAPDHFGPVTLNLKATGLAETAGWKRLVIEKPFGHDYPSAFKLNSQIREVFEEAEIFRIDHYLGKEMVQNIEVIRFANALFEPVWNNRYIANVQITSSETVGVEDRAGYYEKAGALRDMVQNHMLQMVTMVAMEPPGRLENEAIRDEKVKVLRALRPLAAEEVSQFVVRGQYGRGEINGKSVPGFREEPGVNSQSNTETFVAAKLLIDNFRWAGVPFYIRTGKRMAVKSTEIVVQFKNLPMNLYRNRTETLGPNLLILHVQPDEGVTLQLNAKRTGSKGEIVPIAMEFCKGCGVNIQSPEAYERLLYDAMCGDSANFTRWDEVALSWKWIDPIAAAWAERPEGQFPNYAAGTMGPKASDELLAKDQFRWWPLVNIENQEVVQAVEVKSLGQDL